MSALLPSTRIYAHLMLEYPFAWQVWHEVLVWLRMTATAQQSEPLWKKLWSINLPGKVKIFLWRLARNSLPTRMNISRKRIDLDTRCPMCYRLNEDGGHLFLKCKSVKQVWRTLVLEEVRVSLFFFSRIHHGKVYQSHRRKPKKAKSMLPTRGSSSPRTPTLLAATGED
jgi:hypothetical protein